MKADKHPYYNEEKAYLEDLISCLDTYLRRHKNVFGRGADDNAAVAVASVQANLVRDARATRRDPYFARIDIKDEDEGYPESFYIGRTPFLDPDTGKVLVVSWQNQHFGKLLYGGPQKSILGKLMLKRSFEIKNDRLASIIDDYVAPDYELLDSGEVLISQSYGDALLGELLSQSRGNKLRDIVRTIQAQQYDIITSPDNRLLVVQGPPGSGKTQVALHRISYLLYQAREQDRRTPRILVLGPNNLFLNYTAEILPSLGETPVPQHTFDGWMLQALGYELDYELQHESLELLFDTTAPDSQKVMKYRNNRSKSSVRMATLLERYVEHLYEETLHNLKPLLFQVYFPPLEIRIGTRTVRATIDVIDSKPISVDTVRTVLNKAADRPLNHRRKTAEQHLIFQFQQRLVASVVDQAADKVRHFLELQLQEFKDNRNTSDPSTRPLPPLQTQLNYLMHDVRKQIEAHLSTRADSLLNTQIHEYLGNWQRQNVSVAYRRLLRTPALLHELGKGLFTSWELESMHQDAPRAGTPFRFTDLSALHYLKLLFDGKEGNTYDHIVVDEAQDLTPLQFRVLAEYSNNHSITLLGDLGQSIYAYHGVSRWETLFDTINAGDHRIETIELSYRSTRQIINQANDMLRRAGVPEELLVRPFARSGPEPKRHAAGSTEEMQRHIMQLIREVKRDWHSIAIICRSADESRRLYSDLLAQGLEHCQLLDSPASTYEGGLAILPVYLSKGLEFDVVILSDVDSKTYPADQLHLRLLYVALTRAAHSLHICWQGNISPLLDPTEDEITLQEVDAANRELQLLTVAEYVRSRPAVNADWCVERLAGADCLRLLATGKIDAYILDIILEPYLQNRVEPVGEAGLIPLPPDVADRIRQRVLWVQDLHSPDRDDGLAFAELAYGLVRNHLSALGMESLLTGESVLAEQIVAIITLLHAIEHHNLLLGSGRWTTENRIMDSVHIEHRDAASRSLHLLMEYGIVESNSQRIRLRSEWLPGMLALALGHTDAGWDEDLVRQLDLPPASYGWYDYIGNEPNAR